MPLNKIVLGLGLLLASINVTFAQSYNNYLANNVSLHFLDLETKVKACETAKQKREYGLINDVWFNDLDREEQIAIISYAVRVLDDQCASTERSLFTISLMNYTANTGDSTQLDEWVRFNQVNRDQISKVEEIGITKVHLFISEKIKQPFDLIELSIALGLYD
ncbi:hypothetical protein ACODM8_04800 [Vibrio ostreicida]|uniref:hypothetical protein n=1 Tax=Vibrio ostreicida TaxID=526588 RepID=UPI003B596973